MDPMGHGQPSHSSYQRDWGHPYQMGPGHPHQWGTGNLYQMGPGHPYQRDSKDAFQTGLEDTYQRKMKQSFGRSKKIKKWESPKFINQKPHDDHLSRSKHKKRTQNNELLEQLQKTEPCFTYNSSKSIYLCHACNIGLKSPEDLELHFYCKEHIAKSELYRGAVKSPPLRSDNTPCQYINPYLKAETCLSGRYSSKFWLDLIDKVYADLSPSNKQLFIEDMISQAHGCLHRGFHKKLVNAIKYRGGNQESYSMLREAYYKKNMALNCNCQSNISQEDLDEVRGITAKNVLLEGNRYFPDIVDPYLSDTTCEGSEKSSLFWLSKIEEVFRDLSSRKQKKFVLNMIRQAHACLHKDYHVAILELLYGNLQNKINTSHIDLLKIEYEKLNNKFVCSCETGMTQNVLQNEKAKESCADFNNTKILVCTMCQIEFNNQKHLDGHLSGSKHKKRIQNDQLLEQLKKTEPCFTYDSSKRIYLCHACDFGLQSPEDLEIHFYRKKHMAKSELYRAGAVKSPPLRRNKTPCQYINPYLKAETCLSGKYSSMFWLDLIWKVYADLSPSNRQLFIEDMISQAHGCLHSRFHKKIVSAILVWEGNHDERKKIENAMINREGNQDGRMVIQLREAYFKKNMTLNCTCGSKISQEELDEVRGITAKKVPLENVLQTEKAKESCADFNTTETKEELTYEDVLDILELDD